MSRNLEIEKDELISFCFSYTPGSKPYRAHKFDPLMPGDPEEIEDLSVWITVFKQQVDITKLLTKNTLSFVEDECLQHARTMREDGEL